MCLLSCLTIWIGSQRLWENTLRSPVLSYHLVILTTTLQLAGMIPLQHEEHFLPLNFYYFVFYIYFGKQSLNFVSLKSTKTHNVKNRCLLRISITQSHSRMLVWESFGICVGLLFTFKCSVRYEKRSFFQPMA